MVVATIVTVTSITVIVIKRKEEKVWNMKKEEITLEIIIIYSLIAGIILSLVIITCGLLLYYIPADRTHSHLSSKWQMSGGNNNNGNNLFTYFGE